MIKIIKSHFFFLVAFQFIFSQQDSILAPKNTNYVSFIQDFVNEHFKPVKFIKRQRDKLSVDANEDGKGDRRVKQISDVFRSPRKKNKH